MKSICRVLAVLLAACASEGIAQVYPDKPVHIIISFTPGSSTDIVGRVVAAKLSEFWGQPAIAENRAGAGGSIGSAAVAKAAPDGYTLLINSNAHCVNPAIYAKLPYNTTQDFVDIAPLAIQPNVLTVKPEGPYKSVADLVNAARARPGALNIGHAGIGSGTHLNTEMFIASTKIQILQVPFKGTPEVITAMLSGNVDAYWAPISAVMGSIRGGKLRPLAVSTKTRNAQLPDVPTTAESGVTGAEAPLWFGLWGPAGMPPELVSKINGDVRRALADPVVKERLVSLGNQVLDMPPAEFAKFVRSEIADYARVLQAAGVKPQ